MTAVPAQGPLSNGFQPFVAKGHQAGNRPLRSLRALGVLPAQCLVIEGVIGVGAEAAVYAFGFFIGG